MFNQEEFAKLFMDMFKDKDQVVKQLQVELYKITNQLLCGSPKKTPYACIGDELVK